MHEHMIARTTARLGSALTALLTMLVAGQVAGDSPAHLYDLALGIAVVLTGVPAAAAMWWSNGFESRLTAAVLAVLTLVGQVLVAVAGGPGGSGGRWDSASLLIVATAACVLCLSAVDARVAMATASRSRGDRLDPPYAL